MSLDDASKYATIIYTLVALLQLMVVVAAAIYAKGQFDESARSRELIATGELIRQIGDDEVRRIRFTLLHDNPSAADHQSVRRLAVAYDRIGYLISGKLLPEDALFAWQVDEIERLWEIVQPFVFQIRREEARPHYCGHFEWLATEWLPTMAKRTRKTRLAISIFPSSRLPAEIRSNKSIKHQEAPTPEDVEPLPPS